VSDDDVVDLDAELEAAGYITLDGIPRAVARIESVGDGLYAPREDGRLALLIGYMHYGELHDVVALLPKQPKPLTRCGLIAFLGYDHVDRCRWDKRAPLVVDHPITWLHQADNACCVIDWPRAAPELIGFDALAFETPALARRAKPFVTPHAPQLLVRSTAGARHDQQQRRKAYSPRGIPAPPAPDRQQSPR
jgi:hypothetical protein